MTPEQHKQAVERIELAYAAMQRMAGGWPSPDDTQFWTPFALTYAKYQIANRIHAAVQCVADTFEEHGATLPDTYAEWLEQASKAKAEALDALKASDRALWSDWLTNGEPVH